MSVKVSDEGRVLFHSDNQHRQQQGWDGQDHNRRQPWNCSSCRGKANTSSRYGPPRKRDCQLRLRKVETPLHNLRCSRPVQEDRGGDAGNKSGEPYSRAEQPGPCGSSSLAVCCSSPRCRSTRTARGRETKVPG